MAGIALALACASTTVSLRAQELPIPCVAGSCGANIPGLVSSGAATATVNGSVLNVNQTSNSAVLNWSQFNISADGTVNFVQPSASATAINRIHQNDPSRIFGALNANGRVYLLNRNGVLFGDGAKVNVASLVASSLDITPQALENGIAAAATQNAPAFTSYTDELGPLLSGNVIVERGATITTPDGGQVLMFAPRIVNEGTISTPGGQTLLAAGSPVYLTTSSDPNLRGLLVEVGVGGTVTNGNAQHNATVQDPARYVGQIIAERGNVTLAGLAVNQEGRVSATTTVRENGSIRLQARDGGSAQAASDGSRVFLSATSGGALTLARGSVTQVTLSNDSTDTSVDANTQPRSQIELQGRNVSVLEQARVTATGGSISVRAQAVPDSVILPSPITGTGQDGSRIFVATGATLDVSGANAELAMERNVVRAELRGDELADSPMQRDGALRGQAVNVDIRARGTRADGSTWQGTPLADVSGQISLIKRDAAERNLNGGTVSLAAQGDVILAEGSTIDVSGGSVRYRDGYINTSQLLGADGKVYDISSADPMRVYAGTTAAYSVRHDRWGVTETFTGFAGAGRFEAGYVEGKDAGTLNVLSPRAILDGDVDGSVVAGRYQRAPAVVLPAGQLYRPFDQLPLGAQLIFGARPSGEMLDQVGGDVQFGLARVLPVLRNANGSPFDPRNDALPVEFAATTLREQLFGENRVARVEIHSNGSVELPEEVSLRLPGQGVLSIEAGQTVLAGDVIAPAGTIDILALRTETTGTDIGVTIAGSSVLNVSGRWVNDSDRLNAAGSLLAPLLIDGGEVVLQAEDGSVLTDTGSVIDVSAGAWARAGGKIVSGEAGSIELSIDRNPLLPVPVTMRLDGQLFAYGFDAGGSLMLAAPEICIAAGGLCGTEAEGTLALNSDTLLAGGFGSLDFASNERGLAVAAGTHLELRQRNRELTSMALGSATGTAIGEISRVMMLADHLRSATDLTLRARIAVPESGAAYTNANFSTAPGLSIGSGAAILADPGADIALRSNTTLLVDGTISAPAGSIKLTLDNTLTIGESLDAQSIWLGAQARLDASGVTRLQPNELGLRRGEVLDGGSVEILAQRGSVIANPGSVIDVSGTSTVLDISGSSNSVVDVVPTTIASAGGRLSVTAADAVLLGGELLAHGGGGLPQAAGGELQITLNANQRYGDQALLFLPIAERRIVVSQTLAPIVVAPGGGLASELVGQARIAADDLEAAGFSSVALVARTTEGATGPSNRETATGTIEFNGPVDLTVGRELQLDAARLIGSADVRIGAPYVSLGNTDTTYQNVPTLQLGESGSLRVAGRLIDVIGNSAIDGFAGVTLSSEGDLRLRGVQVGAQPQVQGALRTSADLILRADQVYAASLSDFVLAVENRADGVLRVESTGDPRSTVLSAASHLTLRAPTIEQAGVLRAPFGRIDLDADQVHLEAGSLTSTSAEGASILFGSTQAETDWVYQLRNLALVVGDTLPVPEQNVSLSGEQVQVDAGAVIDVSGGGDMLAYEFVPGTTGTRDVLSAQENPDQFAIVPSLSIQYAPFDPQESTGLPLAVGDNIHVSTGVDGLPAGDYVLLPARYALLPGAYLIEAAQGYTDLRPGEVVQRLDGARIVAGYRAVAGTQYAESRSSGFVIRPGSAVANEARYVTSRASEFFAERAAASGNAPPRLPQDAGVLAIAAGAQLNIEGTLRAAAGQNGRGAAVDISAQNLRISDASTAPSQGEVVVSAASLLRLGAESLLLGGMRSSTDDGTLIDVAAENVTIDTGVQLTAPELLIAATDTARVRTGAALSAGGDVRVVGSYLVNGDGAVLRLAGGDQAEIRRSNETGTRGTLLLEAGSQLSGAGGSLALDASLDTQSQATLSLTGGSLALGASRINLGAASAGAAGLTLDAAQLSSLSLDELVLVSRSSIDLYGDAVLNVRTLSLDAAGLQGLGQLGAGSISAAESLVLTNRAGRTATDAAAAGGSLQLNAAEIVLAEGVQRISGYDSVTMSASRRVVGREQGGLTVSGDLSIASALLDVTTGSNTTIDAGGALRISTAAGTGISTAELGGKLALVGDAVEIGTRIQAAAGAVAITARTGDVLLTERARIDVAGRERSFDDVAVAAPAGSVRLTATQGNVVARDASVIDVSAAGAGEAGSIEIAAATGSVTLAGVLRGAAQNAADSGRISVDTASLGDLSALNSLLNTNGFFAQREFRQRGAGNLTFAGSGGAAMRAETVTLTADQGGVFVSGTIDARGVDGGSVTVSARDAVTISGSVLASATATDGDGGKVALRAANGGVSLTGSSLIDVSAGAGSRSEGGDVDIRVPRSAALTLVDADTGNDAVALRGTIRGSGQTSLEAFRVYTDADGILTDGVISAETIALDSSSLYTDAVDFMSAADAITAALGRADDAVFRLLPGIEIQTAGNLSLGAEGSPPVNWNLSPWRFGAASVPGILTLRAGGNLTVNGSLSDGFAAASGASNSNAFRLAAVPSDSWSYRLVAGADLGGADLSTVNANGVGDFSIASGTASGNSRFRMVRTGNGSIDVAAAGDFILGNTTSVLYTAGVASTMGFTIGTGAVQGLGGRAYPVDGGDISIRVGGDIQGAQSDQLVTDWLWRVGKSGEELPNGFATAWTVNFAEFEQNVAALGGGNVDIAARGDVRDFSASIPSIGRQMGGTRASESQVEVIGGGNLTVRAGGDIAGGSYYVGRGRGELWADRNVTTSNYQAISADLYPVLALGDGQWDVVGRGSAGIEGVVNPTLLPQGTSQPNTNTTNASFFSTYTAASAARVRAVSGDVLLSNQTGLLPGLLTGVNWNQNLEGELNQTALHIYAPTLQVASLSADLLLSGSTTLFPAAGATVELLAEGDVTRRGIGSVSMFQSDADPRSLPTLQSPDNNTFDIARLLGTFNESVIEQHATVPVHATDNAVARIVSRTGDVSFALTDQNDNSLFYFATPARVVAAGDIVDLPLIVQHDDATDVSSLIAGGDIRYTISRNASGGILGNNREIQVDGPGTLQLAAAGSIDLQTARGISTRGNLVNRNLADGGADISILAGLNGLQQQHDAMIERYLTLGTGHDTDLIAYIEARTGEEDLSLEEAQARFEQLARYRADLVSFVEQRSGRNDLSADEALALFRGYSRSEQRVLLEPVLFSELKLSGRAAAQSGSGDFTRAFTALETMFPGSNPDTSAGERNAYAGDIALYFSRVYALDGGDISLLAPGGEVNVGLATPPAAFGLAKSASDLGIVVRGAGNVSSLSYSDFQVNESRVFASDGGNILVWATEGDIDAGRGAKTAISAPPPVITFDPASGAPIVSFSPALTGSGIQTLATSAGTRPGDVDLFAPRGVVNAGDAGIVAGNLTIAATAVLGADNIQVSGVAVGVPVDTGGLGAALAGVSNVASAATSAATTAVDAGARDSEKQPSLAEAALSWLDVFVVGLGEDVCDPKDVECLKRQDGGG